MRSHTQLTVLLILGISCSNAWVTTDSFVRRSAALHSTASSTQNVVLRPSTNPDSFDSFKIGNARVHRYGGETESDRTEYVMWYHGRPKDFGSELPPLSTGRIGRATSLNGLQWEKTTTGSESEDTDDVSLGINTESWWGFDTAHVGLGQVLLPMTTPAVLTEGGVYLMYYMGGSFEETPAAAYFENAPASLADAKIQGMKMKIGVAVSQDGMSWGRVEGDDPSGACMVPYDTEDTAASPALDDGYRVDEELYCAWPEVAVRINSGNQQKPGPFGKKAPNFFMFYSTMRKSDKKKCIASAVSEDGFQWAKRGICLEPEMEGLDAGGCARCNVLQKADYDEETGEWKELDGWIMFYEGVSKEDNKHRILMAESSDGTKWNKLGLVLDVGESSEAWDCMGVGSPGVIR